MSRALTTSKILSWTSMQSYRRSSATTIACSRSDCRTRTVNILSKPIPSHNAPVRRRRTSIPLFHREFQTSPVVRRASTLVTLLPQFLTRGTLRATEWELVLPAEEGQAAISLLMPHTTPSLPRLLNTFLPLRRKPRVNKASTDIPRKVPVLLMHIISLLPHAWNTLRLMRAGKRRAPRNFLSHFSRLHPLRCTRALHMALPTRSRPRPAIRNLDPMSRPPHSSGRRRIRRTLNHHHPRILPNHIPANLTRSAH